MSIKTKNAGAYADIVGVFHKRAGAYEAVQGVYAKAGGVYGRVDSAPPLDFIGYGQSNWLAHTDNQTDRPAANENTLQWDAGTSQWITPVGNGVRTFLNAMQSATGRVCRIVSGGQSGANLSDLQKGSTPYTNLMASIAASGINPAFVLWHQGEGDGNTASPTVNGYRNSLNALHIDLAADTGKTVSTLPLVCSSLATVTDGVFSYPDTSWATIQNALAGVNTAYPNMHYSHSNMDATLVDGVHWDGSSYGRSGARYAQTIRVLMGSQSTRPRWYATAAARSSTTETDITVVQDMGTDFTPTTGITGFEVSADNGVSWISATGARVSATSIRLNHADIGTVERLIRYQYGKTPNVSSAVIDNSGTLNLLNYTTTNLVAEGTGLLPTITYASSGYSGSDVIQALSGIAVPGSSESILAIIGHTIAMGSQGATYGACTVTAQPSGTPITATLIVAQNPVSWDTQPCAAIYQAVLPSGTTSIDISLAIGANPWSTGRFHVSSIPVARLNSTTATGSAVLMTAASLSSTTAIATSSGGSVFAVGCANVITTGTTGTIGGTETYATRHSLIVSGGTHCVGDASNVATNASSSVNATFNNSADVTVAAASWR